MSPQERNQSRKQERAAPGYGAQQQPPSGGGGPVDWSQSRALQWGQQQAQQGAGGPPQQTGMAGIGQAARGIVDRMKQGPMGQKGQQGPPAYGQQQGQMAPPPQAGAPGAPGPAQPAQAAPPPQQGQRQQQLQSAMQQDPRAGLGALAAKIAALRNRQ